jgi:hypothetical protein
MGYSPDLAAREGEIGPHSPEGTVCDMRGTPREESAMPRSLFFAWHSLPFAGRSLLFEPCELGGMGHEEPFERREAGGTRREREEMRLEGQGTRREKVFE